MKKTLFVLLCGLLTSLTSFSQEYDTPPFGRNKIYANASLSGLTLNYNTNEKWRLGIDTRGGWLFEDNWMLLGTAGVETRYNSYDTFYVGAGIRYYIEQNGLYLGAGTNFVHTNGIDDFQPTLQLGYAFFVSRVVTIEPEIYYNQSLKNHSDYSGFGVRLGIGLYFEDLF